jgi:4-hydroxy-tetrahydrodipicolinate synthase
VGDRAVIIAGTGSNDTNHSAELTRAACRAGAGAVLVVTPYYNKPSRAGLRAHFGAVAEAAGATPVVLYNIPSRCVVNLPPDLLAELAAEIPNVVAVKQANDEDLGPIEGLDLLAGNDDAFLRTLEAGGTGGILVASHVIGPEMRSVYEAHAAGERSTAQELDAELAPIYAAMAVTSNPTPVKTALEMLGVVGGRLRLPMVPASPEEREVIRGALERRGLLVGGGAE